MISDTSSRLSKIIRAMNLKSFQQYCDFLLADKSGEALTAMIDALVKNHTSFFEYVQPAIYRKQERSNGGPKDRARL
jgi:chemotaxis methyl-accepting protein methylase